MNYAILLSGGKGSRIDSKIPKQYIRCNGCMMVTRAFSTLAECDNIDGIIVVAESEWEEEIAKDIKAFNADTEKFIKFCKPGATRQLSILSGMEGLAGTKSPECFSVSDTVLVHDAARPFLTVEMLKRCYDALSGNDGVMPVLPMKDTVYQSDDGRKVSKLLNRSSIFAGQAPELFMLKKYYGANVKLLPDEILKINGASEPAIMAGMEIFMIPGDEKNFKVTTDEDLKRYESLGVK